MECIAKRSKLICLALFSAFMVLAGVEASHAGVPLLINYQGTLTDKNGTKMPDGNYDAELKIYDVETGGTALWTEAWNSGNGQVSVKNGIFNLMLGSHTALPGSFFIDHPSTYLGIRFGADVEMTPRQRIASAAYSILVDYAASAGHATSADTATTATTATTAINGVPKGGIMMWSGAVNTVPSGWALCDGTNGTPNLKDKFVLGAGVVYSVGSSGGEATHTLTTSEMPSHTHVQDAHTHTQNAHGHSDAGHTHSITTPASTGGSAGSGSNQTGIWKQAGGGWFSGTGYANIQNATATNQSATATNQNTGGGTAHNNMPPYYTLAFIIKL